MTQCTFSELGEHLVARFGQLAVGVEEGEPAGVTVAVTRLHAWAELVAAHRDSLVLKRLTGEERHLAELLLLLPVQRGRVDVDGKADFKLRDGVSCVHYAPPCG